jgi:hypothetical protein
MTDKIFKKMFILFVINILYIFFPFFDSFESSKLGGGVEDVWLPPSLWLPWQAALSP